MRRVYWRLIPLLFVMLFFNYLDRINIGFAALQMNKHLGFSPAVFGFAGSIFFAGYALFGIPSNLALHRTGARRWIALVLVVWGAVAAATAFVWNDASFYAVRFVLGLIEAGFLPGVAVYVTHWFPTRYRARAVGGYIVAGSVAALLGGPVSTAVMTYFNGPLGLQGWQWMFVVEGVPTIVLGLLALGLMTELPSDARWLAADQRAWLDRTLAAERASLEGGARVAWWEPATDIRVWSLACLFGCALVGIYGLLLWLPQIINGLGKLSLLEVGFLSAGPPLLSLLGTWIISVSSDRSGDRTRHLAFVYAMSAIAIAGSAFAPPIFAYVLLCITGLFIYAGNSLFWSLAASYRTGIAGAATIALINTIAQFGGLVGPWTIGLVRNSTGNFHYALLTIAAFLVVSVVIALTMREPAPQAAAERL